MRTHSKRSRAITLIEVIVTLTIIAIIAGYLIPEALEVRKVSFGANCGAALKSIEAAKALWKKDFPGARNPTKFELGRYFPDGKFPTDPWGVGFEAGINGAIIVNDTDEIDLTREATHSYNNNPNYEPRNNCSPNNGYNDVAEIKN